MALILVSDESGEREENVGHLEATINIARDARCRIYVLGREAVFGYPHVRFRYRHPQTRRVHWLIANRGPETAFVEQLQTNGFRRRWELSRAWDRFQIPKPFTRATVVLGEPITRTGLTNQICIHHVGETLKG